MRSSKLELQAPGIVIARALRARGNLGKAVTVRTGHRKNVKPIASVAALTAQPLAALPPYGCGVPLAGSERPVQGNSTVGGR